MRLILARDSDSTEHTKFYRDAGLTPLPYALSAHLGMTYRVGRLPYGVLIDERGVMRAWRGSSQGNLDRYLRESKGRQGLFGVRQRLLRRAVLRTLRVQLQRRQTARFPDGFAQ